MKNILTFALVLGVSIMQAQHCSDNINTVTTDWRSPLSANTWDWTALKYEVYLKNRTPTLKRVISPFRIVPGAGSFTNINLNGFYTAFAQKGMSGLDFHPEDGWELLAKNLGRPPDIDNDDTNAVNNPFFALYNRYTGVIRAFFLKMDVPNPSANGATIKLSLVTNKSAILSHAFAIMPAVGNFDPDAKIEVPNRYVNESEFWLYADFPVTFDPCTCNYGSQLFFEVNLVTTSDIKLEGEINGTITENVLTAQNASVDNSEFGFYAAAINSVIDRGKTGYRAYKDVGKATTDAWKWMESNSQQTQHLSAQKQAYVQKGRRGSLEDIMSGIEPVAKAALSFAGPIGEAAGLVAGAFAFFNDGGETTAVRPPMSFTIQQKITLSGTLQTISPNITHGVNNAGQTTLMQFMLYLLTITF